MANLAEAQTGTTNSRSQSRARTQGNAAGAAQVRKPRARTGDSQPAGGNADPAATTETPAVDPLAEMPILVIAAGNPKRKNTLAYGFFEKYTGAKTVRDAMNAGVRGKDLSWDRERGHILVGDEVAAYQALADDDARRAYLDSKGFSHKMAGLLVVPAPETAETPPAQG